MVARVDAPARKHVRAGHERHRVMPAHQEHFGASRGIA
jgi:hypothetical protein